MSGKGDTPRPLSVCPDTYADHWDRTFGGKPQHDGDERERMRRENLDHAKRVILGPDWPKTADLPTTDPED